MLMLKKVRPRTEQYFKKEFSAKHFIPYMSHWNGSTIITKKEEFLRVIKIDGFSFETADDEDVDIKKNLRNSLFKGMATSNYGMWFHTVRRRYVSYPDGKMPNFFADFTNKEWKKKQGNRDTYINEHYVTIIRKHDSTSLGFIDKISRLLKHSTNKASWEQDMIDMYDEVDEITNRMLTALSGYGAKLLGVIETEDGVYSELLEFLGKIINCGDSQPMMLPTIPLDHYLPRSRLYFGSKLIEARNSQETWYAGMVSIKEYRPSTNAGILDGFLQLPFEMIISQSYIFTDRMSAISSMQLQQNRLIQSEDVAKSQIIDISRALDAAMSGEFAFGKHHLTVLCVARTLKVIESALSLTVVEFANNGLTAVRESVNMEPAYWAQLPCNYDFIVRKSTINTLNLAGYVSFHNYPPGKNKGNHWGNAVTVFNTVSGTPFFFNFHTRDVGHTTIIGPTGAGKTVLMNFLCCQAQKFNGRMFFFDKDRGAEIFIRAVEGTYIVIDKGSYTGFNPLQLEDLPENRSFLLEWFKSLVTTNGEILTAEDVAGLNQAIEGNYKIPKEKRTMKNIAPFLGIGGPGTLYGRFEMWHGDGSHAKLFDNETDAIDFTSAKNFGFEMAEILKDPVSLGPVLLYLFHRINLSLDGTATAIILDEAWALISNKIFAPKIKDWLKVLRKLNAFVVFATQSVEDAANSDISDTLIQQSATQIFLPNLKATTVYRTAFMLSEREYRLIKTTDPSSRFFLVKQAQNSVVARIDLGGMDRVVSVLSGGAETVMILDEVRAEHGDIPEVWLPVFWERLESAKKKKAR